MVPAVSLRAVGEPDLVGPGDRRALREDLDLVAVEDVGVDAFEPLDLGEHVVAQRRPVERCSCRPSSRSGGRPADPRRNGRRRRAASWARSRGSRRCRRPDAPRRPRPGRRGRPRPAPRAPRPIRRRSRTGRSRRSGPSCFLKSSCAGGKNHSSSSPKARAISASVEGSKSVSPSPSSAFAISLPSSTPNWSNGLMPSKAALAKARCS